VYKKQKDTCSDIIIRLDWLSSQNKKHKTFEQLK